jgi:orotate phosphoribosyltransferase
MENIVTLEHTARQVASTLLEIGAIRLNTQQPFRWSSGWNSPIYCDNRLALSYPDIRTSIKEALVETVRSRFPAVESVAGVATAGIPQGVLLADALNLPFLYVRDKAKGHGMTNRIEGKVTPGQQVVVVEDLISTGGSSLKVVDALREAGFEVLGMVAIFTYGFELARKNFEDKQVALYTLSDYNTMLGEAVKENYVAEHELASLREWRSSPETWGV